MKIFINLIMLLVLRFQVVSLLVVVIRQLKKKKVMLLILLLIIKVMMTGQSLRKLKVLQIGQMTLKQLIK